jgi:hypothetical protein
MHKKRSTPKSIHDFAKGDESETIPEISDPNRSAFSAVDPFSRVKEETSSVGSAENNVLNENNKNASLPRNYMPPAAKISLTYFVHYYYYYNHLPVLSFIQPYSTNKTDKKNVSEI